RTARAPCAGPHVEVVFEAARPSDLMLGPPRLPAGFEQRDLAAAPVPALAVGALEQDHVRAAVLPMDRRPQEEDADRRAGDRRRPAGGLADRTDAPRTVLRPARSGAVDLDAFAGDGERPGPRPPPPQA